MSRIFHKKILGKKRGFATLTVFVVSSVMLLLVGAMISYARGFSRPDLNSLLLYNSIEMIKSNILQVTSQKVAWEQTAIANKAAGRMTCYNASPTKCIVPGVNSDPPGEEINIYTLDSSGSPILYYDGMLSDYGFQPDGSVCHTTAAPTYGYDVTGANFNRSCFIKVHVYWRPFCGSDCLVPPEKVSISTKFSIRTNYPITASTPDNIPSMNSTEFSRQGVFQLKVDKVNGLTRSWNIYR
jgi:hypothetical protein